ncbi:glutaminase A [Streptomyces sp. NBC_00193]|uniref:glutaminase A n=1 Tax=Streptomyces sp. NBC_00193 TaxID=2975675 RepID=UPI00224E2D49|nr:glutaminase A [Streptomyces sp. NBC_00193]MCX5300979.1 glutaminase A [Streptomyces sp. NBC_00193]
MSAVAPHIGAGKVADYIPDLGRVDPHQFGFAVATVDGDFHSGGDADVPFALESISKLFSLALVLGHDDKMIWNRVHREPSGEPFNSLIQLELELGVPRNPFINPGAIVVTDQLLAYTGDAFEAVRGLLRAETGNPYLHLDGVTEGSEARTGDRNRALAYLMADFDNMLGPVPEVLEHYVRQCSLMITASELARAGLLFARHGERADGTRLIRRAEARRINALVLTCGTYDEAGEFAYRVGLPCKSGVGGGILAVVPDRCAAVAWGPGLDVKGNSVSFPPDWSPPSSAAPSATAPGDSTSGSARPSGSPPDSSPSS